MHESSTLQPLLAHNDPHAFARDIDATGKKKYFGGDLEHMAKMYERTPHKHWYEVIRADRGTRIFLDIESTAKSRDEVLRGVHSLMKVMKALVKVFADIEEEFYLLDSSDDKKASFHVVGAHLYLKDVFSVGALVRRCWWASAKRNIAVWRTWAREPDGSRAIQPRFGLRGRRPRFFVPNGASPGRSGGPSIPPRA